MLYNLLIFWILLMIITFQGIFKRESAAKKIFLIVTGLTLFLISAFRYETTGDFHANYIGFLKVSNLSFKQLVLNNDEFGHMFLRKIISLFTDNPQWYFVVTGFFIVFSFYIYIYRFSPNVYLSVLLFITIGGFFTSHNITRQYISIAICLWGIPYLISRKTIKYFICIIIAITFHTSAFVMIPVYFLSKIPITKKIVLIYLVIFVIMAYSFRGIYSYLNQYVYSDYYVGESYGTTEANILNIILPSILLVFLFYFIRSINISKSKFVSENDNCHFFNNMLTHMGILSYLFNFLAVTDFLILERFSNFFSVSYLIIVPTVLKFMRKEHKPLIYLCVLGLVIVFFFINNYLGKFTPTPYTPFWWF